MPTVDINRRGTTNTFVVRVLDTDDKGWVGVVTHVQSGRQMNFKGFIEAVRFMDSFIGDSPRSGGAEVQSKDEF